MFPYAERALYARVDFVLRQENMSFRHRDPLELRTRCGDNIGSAAIYQIRPPTIMALLNGPTFR